MSTQRGERAEVSLTELESFVNGRDKVSSEELLPFCNIVGRYSVEETTAFLARELSDESVTYLAARLRLRTITSDEVAVILALILRKRALEDSPPSVQL